MLKEFKEFAMKGNVVDLAVAVIIGAAFGKIITSLVDDIIMPVIGAITGGLDFSNHFVGLSKAVTSPVYAEAKKQGAVLGGGNFLTVAVNFLIIAFILFLVIRALSMLKKSEPPVPPPPPPRSPAHRVSAWRNPRFACQAIMPPAEGAAGRAWVLS